MCSSSSTCRSSPERAYDEDGNGVLLSECFFYPELSDFITADASDVIAVLGAARKRSSPPTLPANEMVSRLIDSEEDELIVRHIVFHYRDELDFTELILRAGSSITRCNDPAARALLILALDEIRTACTRTSSSSRTSARIAEDSAAQAKLAAAGAEAGGGSEEHPTVNLSRQVGLGAERGRVGRGGD